MAIYLKKFENHTQYENYINGSGAILPNVSICTTEGDVHYNPYDPYNGHDYVDLGLPSGTKWATMNIGVSSETDYGNYYQYGKGAEQYAVTSGDSDYSGTENPLAASADTAVQVWGGQWHMPTQTQFMELTANTTYEWVTDFNDSGINGYKFTSKTDSTKYAFFPAGGNLYYGSNPNLGISGGYWSSTPTNGNAYCLYFNSSNKSVSGNLRDSGISVRGVVG